MKPLSILIICFSMLTTFIKEAECKDNTLETWKANLQDQDPTVRCAAADAIGKMGVEGKSATPILTELLMDKVCHVRILSVKALGNIGPDAKEAIPTITKLLEDNNRDVRICAAEALGKMGSEARMAIPNITKLLNDEDAFVRSTAAGALGRMGIEVVPALQELVADKTSDVRLAAAKTLSQLKPRDREVAVSILIGILQDPDVTFWGRFAAANLLGQMGTEAKVSIPALIKLLREKKSILIAADALGQMAPDGPNAALPILTELLQDPDQSIRDNASKALKKMKTKNKKDEVKNEM
jgi:HEAT repeat protein